MHSNMHTYWDIDFRPAVVLEDYEDEFDQPRLNIDDGDVTLSFGFYFWMSVVAAVVLVRMFGNTD